MIKVAKLIETNCTIQYLNFLKQEFDYNMLDFVNKEGIKLFDLWEFDSKSKDYVRFINKNQNIILDFYSNKYTIKGKQYNAKRLPMSLYEFIVDMENLNIDLFWDDIIDEKLEPKDYLKSSDIKSYYRMLLDKMEKNIELLD